MFTIKDFAKEYENLKNECDIDGILKLCENTLNEITKNIGNNMLCQQELIIIKCLMESIRIMKNPHIYFILKIDDHDNQKIIIELFPEVSSDFIKEFIKDCKEDNKGFHKIYLHSLCKNRLDFFNINRYMDGYKLNKISLIHKEKTYICKDTKNTDFYFTITHDISDDSLIPFGIIKKGSDIIDYILNKTIQNLKMQYYSLCYYEAPNQYNQKYYSGYNVNNLKNICIIEKGLKKGSLIVIIKIF